MWKLNNILLKKIERNQKKIENTEMIRKWEHYIKLVYQEELIKEGGNLDSIFIF